MNDHYYVGANNYLKSVNLKGKMVVFVCTHMAFPLAVYVCIFGLGKECERIRLKDDAN